jgi:hypothetical protein
MVAFGIVRLAEGLPTLQKPNHRRNELNKALLAAVQHAWKTRRDLVRTPGAVSDAFRSIVSYLTAQLMSASENRIGMESEDLCGVIRTLLRAWKFRGPTLYSLRALSLSQEKMRRW